MDTALFQHQGRIFRFFHTPTLCLTGFKVVLKFSVMGTNVLVGGTKFGRILVANLLISVQQIHLVGHSKKTKAMTKIRKSFWECEGGGHMTQ